MPRRIRPAFDGRRSAAMLVVAGPPIGQLRCNHAALPGRQMPPLGYGTAAPVTPNRPASNAAGRFAAVPNHSGEWWLAMSPWRESLWKRYRGAAGALNFQAGV